MCSKQLVIKKTIVLLGHQEVGKSTILSRYVKNRFQETYKETIGADYFTKNIPGKSSKVILSIWDTNGDEINKKILPLNIYANASAFLIICSYDKKESLDFLSNFINFIETIITSKGPNHFRNVPILILINKCDIRTNRQFKLSDVYKKLEGYVSRIFIYEVSAKDNVKISYVFNQLIKLTTDKILWTYNDTIDTTKNNTYDVTFATKLNNCNKSFIIEKNYECGKEKCKSNCCK